MSELIGRREILKSVAGVAGTMLIGNEVARGFEETPTPEVSQLAAETLVAYRQAVDAERLLINFASYVTGQSYYVPPLEDYRLMFKQAVDDVMAGGDALGIDLWPTKLQDPNQPVATPMPSQTPSPTK